MSVTVPPEPQQTSLVPQARGISGEEINASFRLPLLVLWIGAGAWLVIGSILALIASIKFHGPGFLANSPWLTYGRVHPAAFTAVTYGFCIPAALGVITWVSARLGGNKLSVPVLVVAGAIFWNLGVALGIFGILSGDATGFKAMEIPRYAAGVLFGGYALLGIANVLTYHYRQAREVYVSQWFMLAAVFWFPWIFSTAILLLTGTPVRGVVQSVIAWWYEANLLLVWMSALGLGILFYLLPKITGFELQGKYTALLAFWVLLVAGSWAGIPLTAPVPAWLPAISTAASSLLVLLLITVAHIVFKTLQGRISILWGALALRFMFVGLISFFLAGIFEILMHQPGVGRVLDLTWSVAGKNQLQVIGFLAVIVFGAIYYILPQLVGADGVCMKLAKAHLWLYVAGLALGPVPLLLGGVMEGIRMRNPEVPFLEVMNSTLHFLRVSTIGELLLLTGNAILLFTVMTAAVKYYKAKTALAYREASAEIQTGGVKA